MMPPGYANVQPYVVVTDSYAQFNSNHHSVNQPNLVTLNPFIVVQAGVTDTMDFLVNLGGVVNWKSGQSGGGFSDMSATIGFPICRQSPYVPQMKLTLQQLFPTGCYKHLNSDGLNLNASGGGAYQTTFAYAISKILFWATQHPMNVRAFLGYTLSTTAHVSGFNSYGGGFGTSGKVRPGHTLAADLGIEWSLSRPWVFALDVVYKATNRTKFHGNPGTTASGAPASVGGGYSDNLSLAPAIEYNWNRNFGFIGGVQFSVYGRNSANFASGLLSVTYTFPV